MPKRSLVIGFNGHFVIRKLLDTVLMDDFEPLPIDLLRHGPITESSPADVGFYADIPRLPRGVRDFYLPPFLDNYNSAAVETADGETIPLNRFLAGYEKIGILSINPDNAHLVVYLSKHFEQHQLCILCTDDEIIRRYNYFSRINAFPETKDESRQKFLFPPIVEEAFESMKRFVIPEQPWKSMLSLERESDLEVIPQLLPLKNKIFNKRHELPPISKSTYTLQFYPKPSLSRDVFQSSLESFIQGWKSDIPLRIITFRNDIFGAHVVFGRDLRCYPYPISEHEYHRIIASCNGMVITPRGGFTTIRDAIRYGLDIFADTQGFSPNRVQLTKEFGVQLEASGSGVQVNDGYATDPAVKQQNQTAMAAADSKCIQWFRKEFGLC